jgi:hypothetical protein
MRRGTSILLLAFFLLGSLPAVLGDNDANLPACCRRNGVHHCAMASVRAAILASGKPIVTAPSTCPNYPGDNALTMAPLSGLVPTATAELALPAAFHSPSASRATARVSAARTRSSRAPPAPIPPAFS